MLDNIQPHTVHEFLRCIIDPKGKLNLRDEAVHHFQNFATLAFDLVWMLRNKIRLHSTAAINPIYLANLVSRQSKEHLTAWIKAQFMHPHRTCSIQLSPFCLQYDAAVRGEFSMAAVVCLYMSNTILEAQTIHLPCITDPLVAEAHAALLAATLTLKLGFNCILLEGDSRIVTVSLREEEADIEWNIFNLISSTVSMLLTIPSWSARKIAPVENSKAHLLAQWAVAHHFSDHIPNSLFSSIWTYRGTEPPLFFSSLLFLIYNMINV